MVIGTGIASKLLGGPTRTDPEHGLTPGRAPAVEKCGRSCELVTECVTHPISTLQQIFLASFDQLGRYSWIGPVVASTVSPSGN